MLNQQSVQSCCQAPLDEPISCENKPSEKRFILLGDSRAGPNTIDCHLITLKSAYLNKVMLFVAIDSSSPACYFTREEDKWLPDALCYIYQKQRTGLVKTQTVWAYGLSPYILYVQWITMKWAHLIIWCVWPASTISHNAVLFMDIVHIWSVNLMMHLSRKVTWLLNLCPVCLDPADWKYKLLLALVATIQAERIII